MTWVIASLLLGRVHGDVARRVRLPAVEEA